MPICMEYDNKWKVFFATLMQTSDSLAFAEDANEEEEEFDSEPSPKKITAITALEHIHGQQGMLEEATKLASTMNRLAYLHYVSLDFARQSTIQEFFHL